MIADARAYMPLAPWGVLAPVIALSSLIIGINLTAGRLGQGDGHRSRQKGRGLMGQPIIDIRDLSIGFTGRSGRTLPVLRNVDLTVCRGESIGIVGESGSGKSTLALASMGFLKQGLRVIGGRVRFNGEDMFARKRSELEAIRGGQLGLIPQNSGQSLTPTLRIGAQMAEALELHCGLEKKRLPCKDH